MLLHGFVPEHYHGPCPRQLQPLRSRVWVAYRDHAGEDLRPVLASKAYSTILAFIAVGTDLGLSVSLGWPSEREAKICTEEAGCVWPSVLI